MNNNSNGKTLYSIIGALVAAVTVMAYFMFAPSEKADLEIDFSDGVKIETN